jgi:short-subunit dehydrogenase
MKRAPVDFRGQWVLVTGASSGLGREMAKQLVQEHGANVIAVARRRDRLEALRDELTTGASLVHPLVADLATPADVTRLVAEATQLGDVRGVILNAGVTYYGHALEQDLEAFDKLLATNVTALVHLCQHFARYFQAKKSNGGVLLVSSMAGFAPLPYQAAYAATKAFVTSYGRSLAYELKGKGVDVSVFAPGGIATEMLELSGLNRKFKAGDVGIMSAEECARLALDGFKKRRMLTVPGASNKLMAAGMKLAPNGVLLPAIAKIYEGALPEEGKG